MRSLLGLRSTAFTVAVVGQNIQITTKGHGHRVGMSQYGAQAMAQEGGRQGIAPGNLVEHKDPAIADTRQHRQNVAHHVTGAKAVQEEAADAAEDNAAGDDIQPLGLLLEDQPHKEDDPDGRSKLEEDGVGRRGQLGGRRVQGGTAGHDAGTGDGARGELHLLPGDFGEGEEDAHGDDAPKGVDGQRLPGNELHQQAAGAEQQSGGKDAEKSFFLVHDSVSSSGFCSSCFSCREESTL